MAVVDYGLDPQTGRFVRLDSFTLIVPVPESIAENDEEREEYLEELMQEIAAFDRSAS